MKMVKLTEKYSIDDNGNLYVNGKLRKIKRRTYIRVGKEVQQLAYWIGKEFVNGYFEGAVIDHIDSDPTNNNPKNLQWITQSENILKRKDFDNADSREIRKYYKENGKTEYSHTEIVKELVWKMRHNGKFRFESNSNWEDFTE